MLQSALEAELTAHLSYDNGDRAAKQTANSRNGSASWRWIHVRILSGDPMPSISATAVTAAYSL